MVEQGSHEELLKRQGMYHRLHPIRKGKPPHEEAEQDAWIGGLVWTAWEAERRAGSATAPASGRSVEFLPAVLEIQHAPPSPIGRAILWTIMAFLPSP